MTVLGEEKPPLTDLVHFGVKGMKWGQKKAELPRHSSISADQEKHNVHMHGRSGARRINERVHGGMDLNTARKEEHQLQAKRQAKLAAATLAVYAGIRLAPVVAKYTMPALQSAANKRTAARGAAAAREAMMAGKGLTNYKTINLVFDGAHGVWT